MYFSRSVLKRLFTPSLILRIILQQQMRYLGQQYMKGDYPIIISRFGSYFILNTHDSLVVAGFIALAFFIINWQLAMHCSGILSQYLVRILIINRTRFVAISLVFCSYFAYLLTVGIFWLFHDGYSIWHGLTLTPVFLLLALLVAVVLPSMKKESNKP